MRSTDGRKFPLTIQTETFGPLVINSQKDALGKGTYGDVYKGVSTKNPHIAKAIKLLNPETINHSEGIPATTLREVNAMNTIKCCNVMDLDEVVYRDGPAGFAMVMELMKGTMTHKLKTLTSSLLENNKSYASCVDASECGGARKTVPSSPTSPLPVAYVREIKVIAWQLLNGVAACHANGVIHRDIKPANVLWSRDDAMKISDFGLARFQRGERTLVFSVPSQTAEICTLPYRAPEVLLGDEKYGLRVDDWSVGCCIAEMFHLKFDPARGILLNTPLFNASSELCTLMVIFDLCGTPTDESYLNKTPWWSDAFPTFESRLRASLPLVDDAGFDLISRLLCVDPLYRSSSRDLIEHPWFDDITQAGLLSRFDLWNAAIREQLAKMRSIINHSASNPSPYWNDLHARRTKADRPNGESTLNDENHPPRQQQSRQPRLPFDADNSTSHHHSATLQASDGPEPQARQKRYRDEEASLPDQATDSKRAKPLARPTGHIANLQSESNGVKKPILCPPFADALSAHEPIHRIQVASDGPVHEKHSKPQTRGTAQPKGGNRRRSQAGTDARMANAMVSKGNRRIQEYLR